MFLERIKWAEDSNFLFWNFILNQKQVQLDFSTLTMIGNKKFREEKIN